MRELEFKNRHGKRMPATLRVPADERRGTFVMLHGLGGWKEQEVITATAAALAESGYLALSFDASDGANGPDGDFFKSTTTGMHDDLEDLIEGVVHEAWFVPPLMLAGHSQGGLVTLKYAAKHQEVAKLVLLAPAIGWLAALKSARAYGAALIAWALAWLTRGLSNWNGPEGRELKIGRGWLIDFFAWNGFRYAKEISAEALIISAGNDHTVATVRDHARLAQELDATHAIVPGAPHHFAKHAGKVADIVKQWLTSS